jgi:undecaprenyl pyrophosphate phosphatase UppP
LAFFYGGPDQIIPLQTGLAALLAVALMFWHKLLATFHRIFSSSKSKPEEVVSTDTTIAANGGQSSEQP